MCIIFQHEAGRKAYDAAVEKIQETKLEINKKEDDLVRLMTELARFQTSLNTAKEEEQVIIQELKKFSLLCSFVLSECLASQYRIWKSCYLFRHVGFTIHSLRLKVHER